MVVSRYHRRSAHRPVPTGTVDVTALSNYIESGTGFGGEKYNGGMAGPLYDCFDFDTMREFSVKLFYENIYARGLIRRLITNITSNGLTLESEPMTNVLGVDDSTLTDWSRR